MVQVCSLRASWAILASLSEKHQGAQLHPAPGFRSVEPHWPVRRVCAPAVGGRPALYTAENRNRLL
eukprot:11613375-Alexandrium_andersonii.AAC.1